MSWVGALALTVVTQWAALPTPEAPSTQVVVVRAPPSRLALTHSAAVGATLVTGALSLLAGWAVPAACFAHQGQPSPVCSGLGLLLGGALQVGLTTLLLPQLYRLADDDHARGDVGLTRAALWRLGRWPALVGLAFITTYLVGALLEQGHYGRGQVPMIVGGAGALTSWLTFDVMQLVGSATGYNASRRAVAP